MALHDYIDYDIDEEKQKNKKNAEKLLKDFSDVEGLKEVLDDVLSLMDSEVYDELYGAGHKNPEEMTSYIDTVDDLMRLKQVKLASEILKDPPLYVASLTGVIIITHFQALFALIGGIHYAHAQKKLNRNSTVKEHAILERLISLLDDFDKPVNFKVPDEEFYNKLKDVKWDKQGKKLFGKIDRIRGNIATVRWGSTSSTFGTTENFALTFLAACNVVHQNRNKMLKEDVVKAYKTYLKLLNIDTSKLM
ncbi:hypothetical protein [Methanobacterium sp.]|uniref:hypothetical protein n=1 Tax=Methanobacterium sp. TaxID=2164 RepID=UPI0031586501